jgi:urease accessory protein
MNIQNLIQNAIRAIPLGPSDGIYVANEIKPFVKETVLASKQYNIEDFGINGFSIEIAQMDHEESLIRLFMS